MFTGVIAFLSGTLLFQTRASLPDPSFLLALPVLVLLQTRLPRLRLLGAFSLGFFWGWGHAWVDLQYHLPGELEGRDLVVKGVIASLPNSDQERVGFHLNVYEMRHRERIYPPPGLISLSWYGEAADLIPGTEWRLRVRLKQPHGFMNPGGFDYEGWLFRRGIRATGYVREDHRNRLIRHGSGWYRLQRLRQQIRSMIDAEVSDAQASGLLKALVIGDRSGLNAADWQLFRQTGTNHLVAISGLHIGIVAGLVFLLVNRAWRRSGWLTLRFAAPRAAAIGAVVSGVLYAGLAGFSVPTQRALVMLILVMGGILTARGLQPYRSICLALFTVLLFDPPVAMSAGFWLSFLAVGTILLGVSLRTHSPGLFWNWGRAQWLIALGLTPVLLAWQQEAPLVAPLVNLIAVPLFSLLLIPLALGGTLLALAGGHGVLLDLAGWLLSGSRNLLAIAAAVPHKLEAPAGLPAMVWISAGAGTLLLLLPRGIPGRWLGIVMLMPVFLIKPGSAPALGDFRFDLLDVGQGLAAVIRTHDHVLVYDTGPQYSSVLNAGSAVLVPFLRFQGIEEIDMVVVSNGDNDHQGGLVGLLTGYRVAHLLSGEPERITGSLAEFCGAGKEWSWDGVRFKVLHPGSSRHWAGNDASCVLQVQNSAGRLLITGDIEHAAEKHLLDCCMPDLRADLVTVPHHGSRTSSSRDFVVATNADYALVSSGYLNRYRLPKADILARWKRQQTRVIDTASSGAIGFLYTTDRGIIGPLQYRVGSRRFWTHRVTTGNGPDG